MTRLLPTATRTGTRARTRAIPALVATIALGAASLAAHAQQPGGVQVSLGGGFKAPITDGTRMVALVSGKSAVPAGGPDAMRVTLFKLETYRSGSNRETELVIESPEGVFDSKGAQSAKALTLRSVDDRFSITGDGWSWDRASGVLVISNRVEASLRRPGTSPTPPPPVRVNASRLEYNLKSGETRFTGNSSAEEPNRARVSAREILTRLTPRAEKPETISAQDDVVIELLRPGRLGKVTGSAARYDLTPEGETIEVDGPAEWTLGATSGRADQLLLAPAREAYTARGQARVRILPDAAHEPAPGSVAKTPVEISADLLEATPGRIAFTGHVFASQPKRLELQADRLVAELSSTAAGQGAREQLRKASASGDVIAKVLRGREPIEVLGQQLEYSLEDKPRLVMTGSPSWKMGASEGKSGRLVMFPESSAFEANDGVDIEWRSASAQPANRAPIRLHADAMAGGQNRIDFTGGVQVGRVGWDLRSSSISLLLGTNGAVRALEAREKVELEVLSARRAGASTNAPRKGPIASLVQDVSDEAARWKINAGAMNAEINPDSQDLETLDASGGVTIQHLAVQAESKRLTYRASEGLLRLIDDARVSTADRIQVVGEPRTVLAFDPATGRFIVEGPVRRMRLPARTLEGNKTAPATPRP